MLELVRGHWSIKNQLFGVRNNLLGEDACRVLSGSAAEALAGRRNVVVCLLSGGGDAAVRRQTARSDGVA